MVDRNVEILRIKKLKAWAGLPSNKLRRLLCMCLVLG